MKSGCGFRTVLSKSISATKDLGHASAPSATIVVPLSFYSSVLYGQVKRAIDFKATLFYTMLPQFITKIVSGLDKTGLQGPYLHMKQLFENYLPLLSNVDLRL